MLARLRAGQRDGRRRRQADDVRSFMAWGTPRLLPLTANAKPGNEEKRITFGGWVKTPVLFLAVSRPKFMKFLERCRGPFVVSMPFPDCLYNVSRWRYCHSYLPFSCEVVENRSTVCEPPNFCGGGRPKNFYDNLLPRFTSYRVAKFG